MIKATKSSVFSFPWQSVTDNFCKSKLPGSLQSLSLGFSQTERKEIAKILLFFHGSLYPWMCSLFARVKICESKCNACLRKRWHNFPWVSLNVLLFYKYFWMNFLWPIILESLSTPSQVKRFFSLHKKHLPVSCSGAIVSKGWIAKNTKEWEDNYFLVCVVFIMLF